MTFVVSRSSPPSLVVPSGPTPAGEIVPFTSMDKARLFASFASLHVFDGAIREPAETIRRALSQALVHYYPVAGRVVQAAGTGSGGDPDFRLACTGEGVAFVAAAASCTLRDVRFLDAPLALPPADLALRYGGRPGVSDPLLMVQVTEFACGGYVVAATWNHGLADAVGLAQFLRAVGELACGLPAPSVAPVRRDESLPAEVPELLAAVLRRHPAGFKPVDFAYCDITIPWSFIDGVKAEFRGHPDAGGRSCTVFEAVTAAIWQCRARAIHADPGAPAPLVFAANLRRHVGARGGYYGNCLAAQLVVAASGAVAGGAVVDLVRLIKDAKERIPAPAQETTLDEQLAGALCGYNALYVSSWGGVGMDGVDFGSGPPARVLPSRERAGAPSCVPCLPCRRKGGDGSNAVARCVTAEHADEFHAQLAGLR
ncbi:hypothetical protein ACP4OV_021259 [Aristida adscensionis]